MLGAMPVGAGPEILRRRRPCVGSEEVEKNREVNSSGAGTGCRVYFGTDQGKSGAISIISRQMREPINDLGPALTGLSNRCGCSEVASNFRCFQCCESAVATAIATDRQQMGIDWQQILTV